MADPRQTGPNPVDTYRTLTRRRRADARRQHFRDRTNRIPKRPMSQSEAIEQAKAMPGLSAYVCRYCGSWHVGHGHKGRAGRPDNGSRELHADPSLNGSDSPGATR